MINSFHSDHITQIAHQKYSNIPTHECQAPTISFGSRQIKAFLVFK